MGILRSSRISELIFLSLMGVIIVGVSFQPKVLEKLDAVRGDVPRSRFLSRLVEKLEDYEK